MALRKTFRTVQQLAAEAGLTMSRDSETLHIRLRRRDRRGGPQWVVPTVDEAFELIARHTCPDQAGSRTRVDQAA
jgi:hypothetical protein